MQRIPVDHVVVASVFERDTILGRVQHQHFVSAINLFIHGGIESTDRVARIRHANWLTGGHRQLSQGYRRLAQQAASTVAGPVPIEYPMKPHEHAGAVVCEEASQLRRTGVNRTTIIDQSQHTVGRRVSAQSQVEVRMLGGGTVGGRRRHEDRIIACASQRPTDRGTANRNQRQIGAAGATPPPGRPQHQYKGSREPTGAPSVQCFVDLPPPSVMPPPRNHPLRPPRNHLHHLRRLRRRSHPTASRPRRHTAPEQGRWPAVAADRLHRRSPRRR